jgi:hypothetical protein
MIGIPTPTCEPSLSTADDTCTRFAGFTGFDFFAPDDDDPTELDGAAALGLLLWVTVTTGPGLVLLLHEETTSATTAASSVTADTWRPRRERSELITPPP